MSYRLRTRLIQSTLVAVLAVGVAFGPARASAAPTSATIWAKQSEAAAAETHLEEMGVDLEEQIEEYNAVKAARERTLEEIRRTRVELEVAERRLSEARGILSRRAAGIYRSGPVDAISVLLGTSSFPDFLNRMDLLMRVSRKDAESVLAVKEAKAAVEAAERALETRATEEAALLRRERAEAARIEKAIAEQEEYVAGLNAEVKRLMDEERKRQEALAAERARQAAEAARRAGLTFDPGSLTAGRPEVVTVALRYLGVPYVWGGTSPSGFDCSGLTFYCYREIGISIPRTSRTQFRSGQHIPADRQDLLVAGDLVFFGRGGDPERVHHVGIYVKDGLFIHAPATGDVVKVDSLTDRIARRGDYVGASRF